MRDEFRAVVSGWTLTSDVEDLGEYIGETVRFVEANGPLQPDEERTVEMMVECQVARGIERGDLAPYIIAPGIIYDLGYLLLEDGKAIRMSDLQYGFAQSERRGATLLRQVPQVP